MMYLKEKFKTEIVSDALEKSGETISQKGDGQEGSHRTRCMLSSPLRRRFASMSPATAMSVSSMLKMMNWPTGLFV